ncbi:MAG: DEAD/DEAH box helicase [Aristaeellaceae bacterium]
MSESNTQVTFESMDLSKEIMLAIRDMGFTTPSTVQARTIPLMMNGVDINAIAPTGTGKTCAFGIPMLEYVQLNDPNIQEVVLAPTRELALQIGDELTKLAKYIKGCRIAVLYGGQPIPKQLAALKRKPQIIVATPGRLLDHMNRGNIRLNAVHTMVLDEADEMLNMGFVKDVTRIIEATPKERQLVLFSATMHQDVLTIAWKYQNDPVEITVEATKEDRPQIAQYVIASEQPKKIDHLLYLLDADVYQRVMIFCNTKFMTDRLTSKLKKEGYSAECLHGDIKQSQRNVVMSDFRKGKFSILVATDVAARGIDVDDVEAVINFDLPEENEYYLHRIGRTGRAHKHGVSFSLVTFRESVRMDEILKYMIAQPTPLHFEDDVLRNADGTPFFDHI